MTEDIEVKFYQSPNGEEPFFKWLKRLSKDNQLRIIQRLNRLK